MVINEPKIESSWREALKDVFSQPYMVQIKQFILSEKAKGKDIFPPSPLIFNAFNQTPFDKVKVVIIGQDPYHGIGQAHGLSFSVPQGVAVPPSLRNIFKELQDDIGMGIPTSGNLDNWEKQGVLLLNAILTVNEAEAASHKSAGWENFTNEVIKVISEKKDNVVFILWGRFAQEKEIYIDHSKHLILKSGHPSPLSVRLFLGCKHFSKTNEWLLSKGLTPINWQL
jgi:uracil-DNA glycosylase